MIYNYFVNNFNIFYTYLLLLTINKILSYNVDYIYKIKGKSKRIILE